MRANTISQETIALAQQMRAAGHHWGAVARATGLLEDTIRRRLDPEYRLRRNRQVREATEHREAFGLVGPRHLDPSIETAAISTVPVDTRSRVTRWMGDPLPGRSALDKQRAAAQQTVSSSFSPVRAERTYYLRGFLG